MDSGGEILYLLLLIIPSAAQVYSSTISLIKLLHKEMSPPQRTVSSTENCLPDKAPSSPSQTTVTITENGLLMKHCLPDKAPSPSQRTVSLTEPFVLHHRELSSHGSASSPSQSRSFSITENCLPDEAPSPSQRAVFLTENCLFHRAIPFPSQRIVFARISSFSLTKNCLLMEHCLPDKAPSPSQRTIFLTENRLPHRASPPSSLRIVFSRINAFSLTEPFLLHHRELSSNRAAPSP